MVKSQEGLVVNSGSFPVSRRDPTDRYGMLNAIFRDARRALKNRNLYSHIQDHGAEQLHAVFQRFQQLLEASGELVLRVEVSTLHWADQSVLEDDSRDMNFVFPLFHAGVRRLTFRPGLPERDFVSFWTHVGRDLSDDGPDDLLTRLWKEAYEHISWVAHIEIDDPDDDSALLAQVLGYALDDYERRPSVETQVLAQRERMAALVQGLRARGTEAGLQMTVDATTNLANLTREVETERERVLVGVGRTLFEIASVESHAEAGEFLADSFEQVALSLLRDKRITHLCALADQAAEFMRAEARPVQRHALEVAIGGLSRTLRLPDSITVLAEMCGEGANLPAAAFQSLARVIAIGGAAPALSLLEYPLAPVARSALCNAIAETSAQDAVTIARKLRNADDQFAREIVEMIGRMKLAKRVIILEPGLQHQNPEIRRWVLQGILQAGEDGAAASAIGRQIERCKDKQERLELIESLARVECREAEKIIDRHLNDEVHSREEMEAFWRSLLQYASPTAFEIAVRAIRTNTRGFLGARSEEDLKSALVEAAGALADIRALKILSTVVNEESTSSRALVKRAQDLSAAVKAKLGIAG